LQVEDAAQRPRYGPQLGRGGLVVGEAVATVAKKSGLNCGVGRLGDEDGYGGGSWLG
jgi:hypothetical protein